MVANYVNTSVLLNDQQCVIKIRHEKTSFGKHTER